MLSSVAVVLSTRECSACFGRSDYNKAPKNFNLEGEVPSPLYPVDSLPYFRSLESSRRSLFCATFSVTERL